MFVILKASAIWFDLVLLGMIAHGRVYIGSLIYIEIRGVGNHECVRVGECHASDFSLAV